MSTASGRHFSQQEQSLQHCPPLTPCGPSHPTSAVSLELRSPGATLKLMARLIVPRASQKSAHISTLASSSTRPSTTGRKILYRTHARRGISQRWGGLVRPLQIHSKSVLGPYSQGLLPWTC